MSQYLKVIKGKSSRVSSIDYTNSICAIKSLHEISHRPPPGHKKPGPSKRSYKKALLESRAGGDRTQSRDKHSRVEPFIHSEEHVVPNEVSGQIEVGSKINLASRRVRQADCKKRSKQKVMLMASVLDDHVEQSF